MWVFYFVTFLFWTLPKYYSLRAVTIPNAAEDEEKQNTFKAEKQKYLQLPAVFSSESKAPTSAWHLPDPGFLDQDSKHLGRPATENHSTIRTTTNKHGWVTSRLERSKNRNKGL